MKRKIIFLCFLFVVFLLPQVAWADAGPKPSVVIDFAGLEGETYYVTLLSKVESTGPYSAPTDDGRYSHYKEGDEDYDIFLAFLNYEDQNGYYFLQYFQNCTDTQQFAWTYYPPYEFKILLYFPQTGEFIASEETYERYAFDSYYKAEVSGSGTPMLAAVKNYDFTGEIFSLLLRVILTIAVEMLIALLFGWRKKKPLLFIGAVNVGTQVILNAILNAADYYYGMFAFLAVYLLAELLVFGIEAGLYIIFLNRYGEVKRTKGRMILYAFAANIASFAVGVWVALCVPGMF